MDISAAIDRVAQLSANSTLATEKAKFALETKDLGNLDPYRYLVRIGDKIEEREKHLKPFNARVDSLEDLIDLARYGEKGETPTPGQVTIWHDEEKVVVRRADSPRIPFAYFEFRTSDAFDDVQLLHDQWFGQKEFIRLLRSDLPDVVTSADSLVPLVRQLKFSQHSEATGVVQLGRESMGREINNEVTAAGDLPESVQLVCPMYDNAEPIPTLLHVSADLDIDLAAGRLGLRPVKAQLIAERHKVAAAIHTWIHDRANEGGEGETIAVYRGQFHFA
ncbi:MAG: hypothetical protein AB7U73_01110 [Pirellulales bacterium]